MVLLKLIKVAHNGAYSDASTAINTAQNTDTACREPLHIMNKACTEQIRAAKPLSAPEAQSLLGGVLNEIAQRVAPYCWKLLGDDPDSLSNLLDIDSKDTEDILRLCSVIGASPDCRLSMRNFESLAMHFEKPCVDWQMYRPVASSSRTPFLRVGNLDVVDVNDDNISVKGSDQYKGEALVMLPDLGKHRISIKPREARQKLSVLLSAVNEGRRNSGDDTALTSDVPGTPSCSRKNNNNPVTPEERAVGFVLDQMNGVAAGLGDKEYQVTTRCQRQIRKSIQGMVNDAAVEMLEKAIANLSGGEKLGAITKSKVHSPPTDRLPGSSTTSMVTPPARRSLANDIHLSSDDDDNEVNGVENEGTALISHLKEEALLIGLLTKKLQSNTTDEDRHKRVFPLHTNNGKMLLVVLPPDTQTVDTFIERARKSNWVSDMLQDDNEFKLEGMLSYLAKQQPTEYKKVAASQRLDLTPVALDTAETVTLGRLLNLNDTQLQLLRSYLKRIGSVELKHSKQELLSIDTQVGLDHIPSPVFGSYTYEWAKSNNKSKKKTPPEKCCYWNTSLPAQLTAEVDLHLQHLFEVNADLHQIPCIDYTTPCDTAGITILYGGDHGDTSCPISAKINFTSPATRKKKNDIGYQCPTIPIASIDCTKDTYEILQNTVMPGVRRDINRVRLSSVVVVYRKGKARECFRSFMVHKTIKRETMVIVHQNLKPALTYVFGDQLGVARQATVDLSTHFKDVPWHQLQVKLAVSAFHDYYVGDLAFLAMLLGMNNSERNYCLLCDTKGANFNCQEVATRARTVQSLLDCREQHEQNLATCQTKLKPANHHGVNTHPLLDVDPARVIVPILHCPMGLVDKILESFKAWANLHVEILPPEEEAMRAHYKTAVDLVNISKHQLGTAIAVNTQIGNAESLAALTQARTQLSAAKSAVAAPKKQYETMIQLHNAKLNSLNQRCEEIYRRLNILREHYHGGKFNGVNCIRIMDKSELLFLGKDGAEDNSEEGFLQKCIQLKVDAISVEAITLRCKDFARMLGILDLIWSSVRGVQGLLPSAEDVAVLAKAIASGKELWLRMGLTTLQPKWHLTFDGHLLYQYEHFGGIADKADDSIEFQHQILKRLRDRYRRVSSFQVRSTCVLREFRRQRSSQIQANIARYEQSKKQRSTTKRQVDAVERKAGVQLAKRLKREAFIAD